MTEIETFSALLEREFSPIQRLSPEQVRLLAAHYELLCRWNKVLNLTRITDVAEAVTRHYCESLFLAAHLTPGPADIIDIGSGGGFPGIPAGVLHPEYSVTLAESHQRKAVFLREATRDLPNFSVLARRSEQIRGAYDWAVSRAVRWADISRDVCRIARRAALLIGEDDARLAAEARDFAWEAPIPLPWGRKRVLLMGRAL